MANIVRGLKQFPLHLVKVGEGSQAMAELKSGETVHGTLCGVDKFTNILFRDAVITSKDGEHFHRAKEIYVRGNGLKYLSLDEGLLDKIEGTKYVCPEKWKKQDLKSQKKQRLQKPI